MVRSDVEMMATHKLADKITVINPAAVKVSRCVAVVIETYWDHERKQKFT